MRRRGGGREAEAREGKRRRTMCRKRIWIEREGQEEIAEVGEGGTWGKKGKEAK